jgi:asparagine synthase (glutamine-hydrolysing)
MYPDLELNWLTQDRLHAIETDQSLYFAQALVPRRNGLALGGLATMLEALRGQSLVLFGSLGNLCLTWAGPFALLAHLQEHDWAGFARQLAATARIRHASTAQVLGSEVIRRGSPAGLRALWRRLHGRASPRFVDYAAVNPDFIARSGIAQIWREQAFDPSGEIDAWNPARFRAWQIFDRVGPDRDNLNWTEHVYGLATRDPFADRRLIEFALSVPERLYSRNGVPRAFARAVFADRLPREIVQETRRGVNRLAWFRTLDRRRSAIAAQVERMEASATARRLLDMPRLKRLVDEWPKDERAAQAREIDYASVLPRAVHIGAFICGVESGGV